jgi:membrane protein
VAQVIDLLVSFLVVSGLFALLFKYVPDAIIGWKDVWLGALVTGFLFTLGKYFIGAYLATTAVASSYGAAGSVVIVLIWAYYSALILFFGAELTQAYASLSGSRIVPSAHAESTADD